MRDIITTKDNIPLVDSRLMAGRLDVRHRDIMRDILDQYPDDFAELGSFARNLAKPDGGGRPQAYYLLNEDQCYLLLTYIKNTPRARGLKKSLVKAFRQVREQLAQARAEREDGKAVRKMETDAIAAMVEYARGQGSESADRYYTAITKMTNEALGIESGQRDALDADTLRKVKLAETMVDIAIRDGLSAGIHYKDIYRLAKDRVWTVVGSLTAVEGE